MAVASLHLSAVGGTRPYHAAFVPVGRRAGWSLLHTHADYLEIFCVLAGSGRHRIGAAEDRLAPGDLVLVRTADVHAFAGGPDEDVHLVNVAFGTGAWRDFAALAELPEAASWAAGSRGPAVRLTGSRAAAVRDAFGEAVDRYEEAPAALDLVRFLGAVVPYLRDAVPAGPAAARGPAPDWLARACARMAEEENLRAGVDRMLELAAVSHGHLARSMRRYHETTPVEFVTTLRLRRAANLLVSTDLAVGEIAQRCGFSAQSYFTRCFGRARGVPPREFRRRARSAVVP